MIPPKSPTSLLWAFELRRQHMSVALRIDALEAALRQRNDNTDIRSMLDEVRGEVKELARRIGAVEANVNAPRKVENAGTVEDEGEEQNTERVGMFGTEMATGALRILVVAHFDIQQCLIRRIGVVNLGQRNTQSTTLDDEETGSQGKVNREDSLFDEIDALQQGERTLVEYVKGAEDILERAPAQWERYIVESFVEGIANEDHRELVANTLTEEGYTWKRVNAAVQTIEDHEVGRGGRGLSYFRMTLKHNPNVTP